MRFQNVLRRSTVPGLLVALATGGLMAQGRVPVDEGADAQARDRQTAAAEGQGARATQSVESMAKARARLTKGELGPKSQPGDRVVFRLQEDARLEDDVVLEKGAEITGTVQSVTRTEIESQGGRASEHAVIHVLWEATAKGAAASEGAVGITMDALTFVHPLARAAADAEAAAHAGAGSTRRSSGGGSSGGLVGGVASTVGGVAGATVGAAGSAVGTTGDLGATAVGAASLETLAAASPTSVDATTRGSVLGSLGLMTSSAKATGLFRVGQGLAVNPLGETARLDLMTRFANDTILTVPANGTQVTSGARAQMLFTVER